jgi:hypothetical protein
MATAPQLVPPAEEKNSPLTAEMKSFIDAAIVPILVREYLADNDSRVAQSGCMARNSTGVRL